MSAQGQHRGLRVDGPGQAPAELEAALRSNKMDATRQGIDIEALTTETPEWMRPSAGGMISCLQTGLAQDAEDVAGLLRFDVGDPELRELWAAVAQRRREIRHHRLEQQRERRRFDAARRRVAATRWACAPRGHRSRPGRARSHERRCSRPHGRARRQPRASRAGPAGGDGSSGEGDDGEPSSRCSAVASRSVGGA